MDGQGKDITEGILGSLLHFEEAQWGVGIVDKRMEIKSGNYKVRRLKWKE